MESSRGADRDGDQLDLPPGFRFHPTDEELITHYLTKKVLNSSFSATAIGDVDLNKCEPWDLPRKAKMGEKEWYFFCVRDRKYPTGLRTNRATKSGYWKATGKDKEIFRGRSLVGMKKTLVFYVGRAPKGEKSSWVMHEYRLESRASLHGLHSTSHQNDWVICRVFPKSSGAGKPYASGIPKNNYAVLPPLTDSDIFKSAAAEPPRVPCFSSALDFPVNTAGGVPALLHGIPVAETNRPHTPLHGLNIEGSWPFPASLLSQLEQSYLSALFESHGGWWTKRGLEPMRELVVSPSRETGASAEVNTEISSVMSSLEMETRPLEDEGAPPSFPAPELGCFWNSYTGNL